MNGFLVEGQVASWAEVEGWLREVALAHYPFSPFARQELGELAKS